MIRMELNLALEKIAKEWLENIENLTYFFCSIEPEYTREPEVFMEYIDLSIEDNKGLSADIIIPLNENTGDRINFNFTFSANMELCNTIKEMLKRFPEKTRLHPSIYRIPEQ